jgi:maltoporin
MNRNLGHGIFFLLLMAVAFQAQAQEIHPEYYSNGYFRGGVGFSEGGGSQTAFQLPGARSKYRLGNEADTYLEAGVGQIMKFGDDGKRTNTYFMIAGGAGHGSEISFSDVVQLYVDFKGFMGAGTTAWVGRKFYKRNFVHMLDHAWINPGQGAKGGAGIDGVLLGDMNLSAAIFQYEDRGVPGEGSFTGQVGTVDSSLIDVRLNMVNDKSSTTFLLQGAAQAKNPKLGIDSASGFAVGAWNERTLAAKTTNTAFLIFREGSAVVQGDFNGTPVRRGLASFSANGYDLNKNYSAEINDTLTYDVAAPWSFELTAGYRRENYGKVGPAGGDELHWYTVGARPVYHFSSTNALALEVGHDHVEDQLNGRNGNLTKVTVAEELMVSPGYFSRPVIRAYFTGATWSSSYKGLVGNNDNGTTQVASPYLSDTFGWTAGLQLETWW